MRHLPRVKDRTRFRYSRGFTFVEVAVIAPIIILMIGAFITVIVTLTADVLRSRGASELAYHVQDAINRIDQDVKLSAGYLAESNIDLTSPQGYDDSTETFVNVGPDGNMLIINALATTGNPLSTDSSVAYLKDSPNACGSSQGQNKPLTFNIVYFVKDDALWRRVVMPSNYETTACNSSGTGTGAPWQRPSCSPGYSDAFCKTDDEKLIDGVTQDNFIITYYNTANATSANTTAADSNASIATRNTALRSAATIGISINATKVIAGDDVSQSSSLRSTRLDTNASTIADPVAAVTPSTPVVTGTYNTPLSATFSWPASSGGGTITYSLDYKINNGSWQPGLTNSTLTSYTVNRGYNNLKIDVRVRATNSAGTSSYGTSSTTIPQWVPLVLQNNWTNYSLDTYVGGQVTKTSAGMVVLEGLIKRSGSVVSQEVIATLPEGYRPSSDIYVYIGASNAPGRLAIKTNGEIQVVVASATWTSLSGVAFLASDADYPPATPLSLLNGWVNYGSSYDNASYIVDSEGRVNIQGMIKSGTTTNNTTVYTLGSELYPITYTYVPVAVASSNQTFLVVNPDGPAGLYYGHATYTSLTNQFYTAARGDGTDCVTSWCTPTMLHSWVGYDVPAHRYAQYTKASDGLVTLRGIIKSGTTSSNTSVFNLPAEYRPSARLIFSGVCASAYCRFDILPNGDVVTQTGVSSSWSTIDNIRFVPDQ